MRERRISVSAMIYSWHSVKYWIFNIIGIVIEWIKIQFKMESLLGKLFHEIGHYVSSFKQTDKTYRRIAKDTLIKSDPFEND